MANHSLTGMAQDHDFDNTFTVEFDNDQSSVALITPTSGKLIKVTGVRLSTEGATSAGQYVKLHFATSADTIAKMFCTNAVQNTEVDPIVVRGAQNEAVSITSTLGKDKNFFVTVNYKEE